MEATEREFSLLRRTHCKRRGAPLDRWLRFQRMFVSAGKKRSGTRSWNNSSRGAKMTDGRTDFEESFTDLV